MNSTNALNARTTARVTAFGFAAIVTMSILAGVDRLATHPAAEWQMARQAAPTQVLASDTARQSNT